MLASILIAAAGYIINDYFDVNIDLINKPNRTYIGNIITKRTAIILHLLFSIAGIIITGYVAVHIGKLSILFINVLCVIGLWYYSTTLKKKLFYGNLIISLLTAWVVFILYLCETDLNIFKSNNSNFFISISLYKYAILYSGFAFLTSILREIVKDIEDVDGDRRNGCNTIPIAWGFQNAKIILNVLLLLINVLISIIIFYMMMQGGSFILFYLFLFVMLPLFYVRRLIINSSLPADMTKISLLIKLIMLAGICSMVVYKISIT
jgi:4-hydroxybenzoate polyprenyltransferase